MYIHTPRQNKLRTILRVKHFFFLLLYFYTNQQHPAIFFLIRVVLSNRKKATGKEGRGFAVLLRLETRRESVDPFKYGHRGHAEESFRFTGARLRGLAPQCVDLPTILTISTLMRLFRCR